MNNNIKKLLVFAWIPLALSCQKKDTTPADLSKVAVIFSTPAAGQVYHKGDTVQISANATYTSEIIGLYVQVIDSASGSVLFEDNHDLHTDHYSFSESWADTLSKNKTLNVVVTVFVANTPEKTERRTYIISQP
jgi:hypothetical protein